MARNSIGIILVAGMSVGTLFTLFVVPAFYALLAAERRPAAEPPAHPGAAKGLTVEAE